MLLALMTNRWVLYILCTLLTFGEMFLAKKWYVSFTAKITNAKTKSAVNLFLGTITCLILAAVQMWALCDVFNAVFYWRFVVAAALTATFIYLAIEKVFGNAENTALGKVFRSVISHSKLFDGELSAKGAVSIANKLRNLVLAIDQKEADKENKAIEEAVSKLDSFLADGKLTEAEKAQANQIIANNPALEGNPTLERYKQLLRQQ